LITVAQATPIDSDIDIDGNEIVKTSEIQNTLGIKKAITFASDGLIFSQNYRMYYLPPSNSSCHFFNSSHLPSAANLACAGQVSGLCIA